MTTTFQLTITGYHTDVCPLKHDENPKLKFLMERIDNTFDIGDEDSEAMACAQIDDMDQLMLAIEYYRGKRVKLSITCEATQGGTTFSSTLAWHGATAHSLETCDKLTPSEASAKIIAICRAMEK